MNLKPVQIQLETGDVQRILQIALDDDTEQALSFIQAVLAKKVEKELQRH
ncbi:MAG: hypothetical protein KKA35_16640 [Proteobacteria bacterium]|nr:hypothetical protein [Pseudomonadota bacterium]